MYTKLLPGQIIFYYPYSELFDEIQHQSAFMCKNVVSKEGEDLSERFAITDDEAGMFQICLFETMPDVYDTMKTLTHGISGAVFDGITGADLKLLDYEHLAPLDVENKAKYAVIRIVDHAAYNPNTVTLVDSTLRSTIEMGVLASFYMRVTHPDITKMAASMFTGQNQALANRIVPLKKKTRFP